MYHNFLIQLSADGLLGCFHFLAIINSGQADSLPPSHLEENLTTSWICSFYFKLCSLLQGYCLYIMACYREPSPSS